MADQKGWVMNVQVHQKHRKQDLLLSQERIKPDKRPRVKEAGSVIEKEGME